MTVALLLCWGGSLPVLPGPVEVAATGLAVLGALALAAFGVSRQPTAALPPEGPPADSIPAGGGPGPASVDDGLGGIVFDSMAEGLLIADQSGRLVLMNRSAEEIFGAAMRDVPLARWATDLDLRLHDGATPCPPGDFPLLRALRGESVAEVELLLPGRLPTWITGGAQPLRNDKDRPGGAVMVFRDVTSRRRAEEALRDERIHRQNVHAREIAIAEIEMPILESGKLRPLLDRVGELTAELLSVRGARITICDPEVGTLLANADGGVSSADRRGFRPPAAATAWIIANEQPLSVADATDDPFAPDELAAQGVRAYAGAPLIGDSGVLGVLFVDDDRVRHFPQEDLDVMSAVAGRTASCITRVRLYESLRALNEELARNRAQLESLVQARTKELEATSRQLRQTDRLASIGTLTAGLGHDMNNVLFPVRCRLDALRWDDVPKDIADLLQSVSHAVTYLQQLTDGLRLFALDPDDADASTSLTDLRAWWTQVSPLLTKALPGNVTLESHLESALPPVRVAPHRLTQALLNLVVNAGEAMPNGGAIRIRAHAPDAAHVCIAVADEGHGMTPQVRLQAFDPFFTTKTRGLSTGLGLSLVHGVVTSSRGTIDVDTGPGRGTIVTLSFPSAERRPVAPGELAEEQPDALVELSNDHLAAWIVNLLKTSGYRITSRADGVTSAHRLLITDAVPERLEPVRLFLADQPHRHVIAIGVRDANWNMPRTFVVEPSGELNAIRSAINVARRHGARRDQ